MAYDKTALTNIEQLELHASTNKRKLDALSARLDAQVTASTDANADYAAEVVDARVDWNGTMRPSLGSNIRITQSRAAWCEEQVQNLAIASINNSLMFAEIKEKLRDEESVM